MSILKYPTLHEVQYAICKHIEHHLDLSGDVAMGELGSQGNLSNVYSGRIVFELIQNAMDQCERYVSIHLDLEKNILYVGNDGKDCYRCRQNHS